MFRFKSLLAVMIGLAMLNACHHGKQTGRHPYNGSAPVAFYAAMDTDKLISLLAHREHQVRYYLPDELKIFIGPTRMSSPVALIRTEHTPSGMVERHLVPRLQQNPQLLLPAFTADDPDIVLTALFAYGQAFGRDSNKPIGQLSHVSREALVNALRDHCFDHRDVRVRQMAVQILAFDFEGTRLLKVDDLAHLLRDGSASVRNLAVRILNYGGTTQRVRVDIEGEALHPELTKRKQWFERRQKTIPLMIEHLNDPHPGIRLSLSFELMTSLFRWEVEEDLRRQVGPPGLPERFDWGRSSWEAREAYRQVWLQWWDQQGQTALRWVHALNQP